MNIHVEIDTHWCLEQLLQEVVSLNEISYLYKPQIGKRSVEMASITVDCAF